MNAPRIIPEAVLRVQIAASDPAAQEEPLAHEVGDDWSCFWSDPKEQSVCFKRF